MDPRRKACIAIILALGTKRNIKRRRWMKNWLEKREKYSHVVLLKEICATESEDYKNYFHMSKGTFDKLLRMVEPLLIRKDTNMRESLFKYTGLVGFHSSGRASYVSMKFQETSPSSAFTSLVGDSVAENSVSLSMSSYCHS
jgi:hypothetical protein